MKTKFLYRVMGDITNRLLAKTVDIHNARHISRFFMEERLRIEGIYSNEVEIVENPPTPSLLPVKALKTGDAL